MLIDFAVCDDGSIKVLSNYIEHISKFRISGFEREDRFFSAANVRAPLTPAWFIGVRKASIQSDIEGIDGFADVIKKTARYTVKLQVPFQLKSSRAGCAEHLRIHPRHSDSVLILRISTVATDEQIRSHLYSKVGAMLRRNQRGELKLKESESS